MVAKGALGGCMGGAAAPAAHSSTTTLQHAATSRAGGAAAPSGPLLRTCRRPPRSVRARGWRGCPACAGGCSAWPGLKGRAGCRAPALKPAETAQRLCRPPRPLAEPRPLPSGGGRSRQCTAAGPAPVAPPALPPCGLRETRGGPGPRAEFVGLAWPGHPCARSGPPAGGCLQLP